MLCHLQSPSARPKSLPIRGSTLVETLVALVIVVFFLAGTYASNIRIWSLMRSSLESSSANRTLNGRAEQLRASTWSQVVDPVYLRDSVLSIAPDAGGDMSNLFETIDVIAYPAPATPVAAEQVTRDNTSGYANVVAAGDGTMGAQASARINLTATWTAKGGRSRTRQISLVFAPGGVSGRK